MAGSGCKRESMETGFGGFGNNYREWMGTKMTEKSPEII
jgi:hypothetical protein